MDDGFKIVSSQGESTYDDGKRTSLATMDESYQIGEHIAANFSDDFYDGETLEQIDDSTYRVSCMSPKAVSQQTITYKRRCWYWPSKKDIQTPHMF